MPADDPSESLLERPIDMLPTVRGVETSPTSSRAQPLLGRRVGVTAARKASVQIDVLARRGAHVEWAPALQLTPSVVDVGQLRRQTDTVLGSPFDLFIATTGVGIDTWFGATESRGLGHELNRAILGAEVIARGAKTVAALRRRNLRVDWAPRSECFADVLDHLASRSLSGCRIILQEHGRSLRQATEHLRARGATVQVVEVYKVHDVDDPARLRHLIDLAIDGRLTAVTFTSAPAVASFIGATRDAQHLDALIEAFRAHVLAVCVGPVAADAFSHWRIPTIVPTRPRLVAMIDVLEEHVRQHPAVGSDFGPPSLDPRGPDDPRIPAGS